MTTAEVIDWLVKGGAGAIVLKLVDSVLKWYEGRHRVEQKSWVERDKEARKRRMLEEYAHTLRNEWHLETNKPYDDMPAWPTYNPRSGRD